MNIKFTKRNEEGLHCRFCNDVYESIFRVPKYINLFETSPITGIVCENCKRHLENYLSKTQANPEDLSANSQKNQSVKEEIRKLQVPLSDKSIRKIKELRKIIAD